MVHGLDARQLTGRDDSHLVALPGDHRLQAEAAAAFIQLHTDASAAGFELSIASSFRSFARQLAIWNGKVRGDRPVYDDQGGEIALAGLSPREQLYAILRYSAIPGTSRHHWGTDLDIYDKAAMDTAYQLQLSPQEVAAGGIFDPLHCWLDERIAAGASRGFYRPYARDRGGVAPERWHLSYAPLARACSEQLTERLLQACWDCEESSGVMLLRAEIRAELPQIMARYVAVADDWCPRG